MEAHGWAVRYLGANLPHSTILSTIEEAAADVLCISTTLVANLPSTAELIHWCAAGQASRLRGIVVGGAAFRSVPEFATEIGATEVIRDLRQALATL